VSSMQKSIDEGTWWGIIDSLEVLMPFYERTNLLNTWCLLPLWRRELSNRVGADEVVLEIGSGPGGLARLLRARRVICLDPSIHMLHYCREQMEDGRYGYVSALAEDLPFARDTFDRILCSFSFRDFMDKPRTFSEMLRILKPGGTLHILEVVRPKERWRRAFMDTWIDRAVPMIAQVVVPRRVSSTWGDNPFARFAMTYKVTSPIDVYAEMATQAGFGDVKFKSLGMKSVFHLRGVKPRTTS